MNRLFLVLCSIILSFYGCQSKPPTEKYIEMEEKINSDMPYELNPRLRMDKVKAVSKNKFKYFYTLLNEPDISASTFIDSSKPQIINSLKGASDSQKFKEDNMTIIYSYSRKDGSTFAEIEISPSEY